MTDTSTAAVERAEAAGIIAAPNHVGKREVLLKPTPPREGA